MLVELLIKSPNQEVDDLEVKCDASWSIRQLKDHLSAVYPTKPLQSQQRIIYCGRVLPDHLLLKEVLTKGFDVHTMHLVCPQSTYSSSSCSSASPEFGEQAKHSSPDVQNVIPTAIPDGLRERFWDTQNNQFNVTAAYFQGQIPQVGAVPMAYQLAAMQQTYAQIMAQFLAQNQTVVNRTVQPPSSPQAVPEPTEDVSHRQQNPIPAAPNANRPFRENAAAEHDFLDSLYIMSRVLILCMVVYFYSTPGKVLMVLVLGLFLCVCRAAGFARQRQRRRLNQQNNSPQRHARNGEVPTQIMENREELTDNSENRENLHSTAQSSGLPAGSTGLSVISFVKTFFTSLIPEQPVPVET